MPIYIPVEAEGNRKVLQRTILQYSQELKLKKTYKYSVVNDKNKQTKTYQHPQLIHQCIQKHCPKNLQNLQKIASKWSPGRSF